MSNRETRPFSQREFDDVISANKDRMIIQKIGLAYGSTIFFLMGSSLANRDEMFDITLWGYWWRLYKDEEEICNSENIDRNFAETKLFDLMKGIFFQGVSVKEKDTIIISFSNNTRIVMYQIKEGEYDYDDYFFLSIPDDKESIIILKAEIPPKFVIDCKI